MQEKRQIGTEKQSSGVILQMSKL